MDQRRPLSDTISEELTSDDDKYYTEREGSASSIKIKEDDDALGPIEEEFIASTQEVEGQCPTGPNHLVLDETVEHWRLVVANVVREVLLRKPSITAFDFARLRSADVF